MEHQASSVDRLKRDAQDLDLKTLLTALEERALARAGGQFTIMRVTTGWKIMMGEPEFSSRSDIEALRSYPNLYEALLGALAAQR